MHHADYSFDGRLAFAETLPSHWYTDPSILEQEKVKIFARTWQLVGRAEQVVAPGDYFTAVIADEPVIVARGVDRQFRVETWGALVFVNLDPDCAPLAETMADLSARMGLRDVDRCRLAARKDWYVDCNWKVYVDNYLEGYHVPIVHPSLNREIDYDQYRTETQRYYSIQHSPIRRTREARLRVPETESGKEAQYFWIFPNLMINVYPDNYSTNLIVPVGPARTLTVFEWYFRDPEHPAAQEALRRTIEFSDEIQIEDIRICEAVQRGLRSRHYTSGRYSVKRENGVHHFHGLLAE